MDITKKQVKEIFEKAAERLGQGGEHYGIIHNWIKSKFRNGCRVTWGSYEFLQGTDLTVIEMEELTLIIALAAAREIEKNFNREYDNIKWRKEILGKDHA